MKSRSQKLLASEILGVGSGKIWFDPLRLEDIQQAITRNDIRDLIKDRAIKVKAAARQRKVEYRKRKGSGRIKLRVSNRKQKYVSRIRKMRSYIRSEVDRKRMSKEQANNLRKLAKAGQFRNLKHLKENVKPGM